VIFRILMFTISVAFVCRAGVVLAGRGLKSLDRVSEKLELLCFVFSASNLRQLLSRQPSPIAYGDSATQGISMSPALHIEF